MTVVTRFAPSPTGHLHIGGARTALFNWLFARHHGGRFYLRIEDTDASRNNAEAIQPIMDGLQWLGLNHDGGIVHQSMRVVRHVEVAHALLAKGAAYRCFMGEQEIADQQARNRERGLAFRSGFREGSFTHHLETGIPYVIRFKASDEGSTTIHDLVQGDVTVQNSTIDDMVLLRSDGTPTFLLSGMVDDHDMGITHVIRGDDHLSNAFRQLGMIRAMEWVEPIYAHIPLIHDEKGKKLSKRHGAAGLDAYWGRGYLSDAVFNYLLRMGWGHGDHEIFTRAEAINLFDLDAVGKAPARLDQKRLDHLNGLMIRDMTTTQLGDALGIDEMVKAFIPLVRDRSKTLGEARSMIGMALQRPRIKIDDPAAVALVTEMAEQFPLDFTTENIKTLAMQIAEDKVIKLNSIAAPMRLAIMGSMVTPPLFEVMAVLGREECRQRIEEAIS